MKGGRLYKLKPRQRKPIPKESKTRKVDNRRYRDKLEERWANAVINGANYCIFCGDIMPCREDNHHCTGRAVTILDEISWAWAHRKCHSMYHSMDIEALSEEPWWEGYLERVRRIDESQYWKEKKKQEKAESDLEITN